MNTPPTHLLRMLRRGPGRKDGRPGLIYARMRLRPIGPYSHEKSVTLDLPLETTDSEEALERLSFLLRSFVRAGKKVMGDLSELTALAPPKPTYPPGSNHVGCKMEDVGCKQS